MNKKYFLPKEYQLLEYDEVESTMTTAKNIAEIEEFSMSKIIWAKRQTQGRGRQGKKWISPLGNLYFSFIRKAEKINKKHSFAPVYIISLSLAETIQEISNRSLTPFLKWPNDLLINGNKLAGILLEKFSNKTNQDLLNIGIGININNSPKNVDYDTTFLKKENVNISAKNMLLCFFNFLSANEKIYNYTGIEEILQKWKNYSHKINDRLFVRLGDDDFYCYYQGIDKDGALIVKLENKKIRKIYSGDIFIE